MCTCVCRWAHGICLVGEERGQAVSAHMGVQGGIQRGIFLCLSCLRLVSFLDTYICVFNYLEKCLAIISLDNSFCPFLLFLLLELLCVCCPTDLFSSVEFFVFFLLLRHYNFKQPLFKFSDSSASRLLLKLSSEIFISVIVVFDSRIFLWFFSVIPVSLLLLYLLRHCSGFLQLFVFQTVEGCVSSGTVSANSFCL